MNRPLLASALGAFVLFAPLAVQAQTKLDPTALAMSNAAPLGSPVSSATTPYDTSATATTGTDNAGNYSGDYNGQNQGTGFLGFGVSHTGGGYAGSYIGSSNSSIDTSGNSFGVYANSASDATVNVSRSFASPLQYTGDSFSIQLRTDFTNSGSGQTLTYKIGGETLTLSNTGYALTGGTVVNGLAQSDYILNATYTVGANNTYNFTVNGNNPATDKSTATGTYTQAVNQFQIIGTNLPNNQFFNNLSITNNSAPAPAPEPGGLVPLLMGVLALGGLIIKRRRAVSIDR